MPGKRKWRVSLSALAIASLVPFLSGAIVEVREYRGKRVTCVHSGLMGVAKACGTHGYARVFTGTVRSAIDIGETEKRLLITPDEVFLGGSTDEVVAVTNQACLHTEIQAGDKWLFYLFRDAESDSLLLPYDSPSKPIIEADDDISRLRDLARTTDSGILIGSVKRLGATYDVKPAPLENHKVVAENVATGTQYTTFTTSNGHFKFELPEGFYDVTATTEHGYREIETFPFRP